MAPRDAGDSGKTAGVYRYTGAGLQFAATIGVFGALGYWLDGKLGSLPLFLIAGIFLGFALGTRSLVAHLTPKGPPRSSDTPPASDSDSESKPDPRRDP